MTRRRFGTALLLGSTLAALPVQAQVRTEDGETGAIVVPSFDDPDIVAGQGTAGLEIADQLAEAGAGAPARIVIPCGGGGLAGVERDVRGYVGS